MSGDVATARVDVFTAKKDDLHRLDPVGGPAAAGWPYLDSSDWAGGLDRLVAEISGRDISEFGDHELVFPDRAAGDWDGPWLVRVPEDVVDAFAVLSHEEITGYADRAALGDEQTRRTLALWEMCCRARGDQDDVYQWSSE
ncbi:MAG TPA: hypothetical protein VH561_19275 [Micromonosporaceae bacterium]|jgi:hypothetical protein